MSEAKTVDEYESPLPYENREVVELNVSRDSMK